MISGTIWPAFLDGFPVSKGHTLVIPKRHVVSLWEMTSDEYMDAFALVRQIKDALQDTFNPQGFNWANRVGVAVFLKCPFIGPFRT